MRCPMCSVSSFLTVSVDYTYGFFFLRQLPQCPVVFLLWYNPAYTVPSFNIPLLFRTVVTVKSDNGLR